MTLALLSQWAATGASLLPSPEGLLLLMSQASEAGSAISNADLVASAASRAEDALIKRYDFYWGIAAVVGAVLAIFTSFLGIGVWKNIRETLKAELTTSISTNLSESAKLKDEIKELVVTAVSHDLAAATQRLERQIKLNRLQYLANKIRQDTSFSNAERDQLVEILIALKDDSQITSEPDFNTSLEHVLDAFYGASIWHKLDELEAIFFNNIKNTFGIIQTMVMAYGLRVIGAIDDDAATIAKFSQYLGLMEDYKSREIATPWKMALELAYPSADTEQRMARLIDDSRDFQGDDLMRLGRVVDRYRDLGNFARQPRSYHRRINSIFMTVHEILTTNGIAWAPPPTAPAA